MEILDDNFNDIYKKLLVALDEKGVKTTNRKGDTLTSLKNVIFELSNPWRNLAVCRDLSMKYLKDEFSFYLSGSNLLVDAVKCSKFWKKCSDDGQTINSNYGKLLFHDKNCHGFTQFEHAVNCIKNSYHSKKAVMTLYNNEHAYISNDNPCTMFLQAMVENDKLYLTTHMRSSDVFYGLPYDVPFFTFVQIAMLMMLSEQYPNLTIGTYTHIAGSLHSYDRNATQLQKAKTTIFSPREYYDAHVEIEKLISESCYTLERIIKANKWLTAAWSVSKHSTCLKKKVGCVIVARNFNDEEYIASTGFGDVAEHRARCTKCVRDDENDKWYGDSCPSIHSEMRAIISLLKKEPNFDFSKATIYLTHGPCDACCKLMDMVHLRNIVYDVPYKTNYRHWPELNIYNKLGQQQ